MAVSPIGPVREVLDYAVSEMPPSKILMGQNLYGYDWTLPFIQGRYSKSDQSSTGDRIAANNNVPIRV